MFFMVSLEFGIWLVRGGLNIGHLSAPTDLAIIRFGITISTGLPQIKFVHRNRIMRICAINRFTRVGTFFVLAYFACSN